MARVATAVLKGRAVVCRLEPMGIRESDTDPQVAQPSHGQPNHALLTAVLRQFIKLPAMLARSIETPVAGGSYSVKTRRLWRRTLNIFSKWPVAFALLLGPMAGFRSGGTSASWEDSA